MDAVSLPTSLISPTQPVASAAEMAKRGQIEKTAKDFESSFLSVMIGEMMKDVNQSGPFGGGVGEEKFKSFMADAFAKQMTAAGGIGLADSVTQEMLKLQGLN